MLPADTGFKLCINDIHVTLKDQIEHFFTYYKDLDEGKWVKIDGWGNAEEAKQELFSPIYLHQGLYNK
jgi:inorganic pyrophosphatase